MPSVILHISNEDPVLGEMDDVPGITDTLVMIKNPRKRDGKDIAHLDPNVLTVIWPLSRINFIEVLPSGEEEEIITHVRE
ncbi:MAG TPA: hypothetical protein VF338_00290 [Leptolinea sp.]